ncbi:MAG TPA: DUF2505 family protein [Nannocystis sp.]|jgi:hypothetical protein
MKKVHLSHEINCSPEVFWKLYFDPVFTEALLREAIKVDDFKVVKMEENDREIVRVTTGKPRISAPAAVQKIIGDNFSYTEEARFDRQTQTLRWKISLSTFTDKTRNEGTMRLEPIGTDRVRRIADAEVEAKIFGMGGMMESGMEKQMTEGWTTGAEFTNRWIAAGKAPA